MAQAKPEQNEWVTREEAASILGVNERQVQKRAEQGYLERSFLPRRPNERQARVRYARRDLEAILAGTPNQHGIPVAPSTEPEPFPGPTGDGSTDLARIRKHLGVPDVMPNVWAWPPPAREPRAWLTLEEAAEWSGLPAPIIAELLRTSQVDSIGRGPKTWRIRRASLDAWGTGKV